MNQTMTAIVLTELQELPQCNCARKELYVLIPRQPNTLSPTYELCIFKLNAFKPGERNNKTTRFFDFLETKNESSPEILHIKPRTTYIQTV